MNWRVLVLTTICVLCIGFLGPIASAETANADIQIRSVNVSAEQPAPGETFQLGVNIANFRSSSSTVEVTQITVREAGSPETLAKIANTGSIAPGGNLVVPMTLRIDEPGGKRLIVEATVENDDEDEQRVRYPVYIEVKPPNEAIVSFSSVDATAGQEANFNVTVSNGGTAPLSNVRLQVDGEFDAENPERVLASLEGRTQTSYQFRATFDRPGPQLIDATVRYQSNAGGTRTVNQTVQLSVERATNDVEFDVSNQIQNESSVIRAELYQFGNVRLENVQIRVQHNGETVTRAPVADIPGEAGRTVLLSDDDIPAGNVSVVAVYDAGSDQESLSETLLYSKYSPAPTSAITFTGIETTRDGGTLTISGDVVNVGTTQVNSVLITAATTESTMPVDPVKEYFIDNVGSNEFESFEATVNTSRAPKQLPLQVEYTINGQRVSSTIPVDLGTVAESTRSQDGGSPLLAIMILLIVVVVVGIGMYRWRR